jgi:hypothetical protein
VKGVKRLGVKLGNWLTTAQGGITLYWHFSLAAACADPSWSGLRITHVQLRDDHWAIIDLFGKGGHVRTVPVPVWVKTAIDLWLAAARITEGCLFRCVSRTGTVWGSRISEKLVWWVVRENAKLAGIDKLSPHDLRRTCARLCHSAGGAGADPVPARTPQLRPRSGISVPARESYMPSMTSSASNREVARLYRSRLFTVADPRSRRIADIRIRPRRSLYGTEPPAFPHPLLAHSL